MLHDGATGARSSYLANQHPASPSGIVTSSIAARKCIFSCQVIFAAASLLLVAPMIMPENYAREPLPVGTMARLSALQLPFRCGRTQHHICRRRIRSQFERNSRSTQARMQSSVSGGSWTHILEQLYGHETGLEIAEDLDSYLPAALLLLMNILQSAPNIVTSLPHLLPRALAHTTHIHVLFPAPWQISTLPLAKVFVLRCLLCEPLRHRILLFGASVYLSMGSSSG